MASSQSGNTPRTIQVLATLLLAALLGPLAAQTAPLRSDGPYVLWEGREARVLNVRDGKAAETRLRAPYDLDLPGLGALRLEPGPPAPEMASLPLPERIAALSDVHGNLAGMTALLQAHGVIDAKRQWAFGRGHLVVAGDVFDRGGRVTDCFWLLRYLEDQARKAGGHVHMILGNHEVLALRGDERYLHQDYQELQKKLLGLDQKTLYGPTTELGRWLRSRPVLLRLGPFLFVHGGPSPAMVLEEQDLEALNAAFRRTLDEEGKPHLQGRDGPIWYRGLIPGMEAKRPDATDQEVESLLKAFRVRAIVVGHSTLKTGITTFHGGRICGIDANLQVGGSGELWIFQKGACYKGFADGSRLPLEMKGPFN